MVFCLVHRVHRVQRRPNPDSCAEPRDYVSLSVATLRCERSEHNRESPSSNSLCNYVWLPWKVFAFFCQWWRTNFALFLPIVCKPRRHLRKICPFFVWYPTRLFLKSLTIFLHYTVCCQPPTFKRLCTIRLIASLRLLKDCALYGLLPASDFQQSCTIRFVASLRIRYFRNFPDTEYLRESRSYAVSPPAYTLT